MRNKWARNEPKNGGHRFSGEGEVIHNVRTGEDIVTRMCDLCGLQIHQRGGDISRDFQMFPAELCPELKALRNFDESEESEGGKFIWEVFPGVKEWFCYHCRVWNKTFECFGCAAKAIRQQIDAMKAVRNQKTSKST